MSKNSNSRRLGEIGEKRIVEAILEFLAPPTCVSGGRGNDATALDLGLEKLIVITADRCPTPLAFKMEPRNFGVWGDLAITCVASDLLASGTKPAAFLVNLLLPRSMTLEKVLDLLKRAEAVAKSLGAEIVAGDTKESSHVEVVTTGLGLVQRGRHVRRLGARPGDLLVLTGKIGNFTAANLAYEKRIPESALDSSMMTSVYKPRPAYNAAMSLLQEILPSAGMDLSDGLLSTVFTLAEINGLGVILKESEIPISAEALSIAHRLSVEPLRLAFGTGDWQIAYAIDPFQWEELSKNSRVYHQLFQIGRFTKEFGVRLKCKDGTLRKLRRIEQQHFLDSWADRKFLEYLMKAPLFT